MNHNYREFKIFAYELAYILGLVRTIFSSPNGHFSLIFGQISGKQKPCISHVLRSKHISFYKNVKNQYSFISIHTFLLCHGVINDTKYNRNWPRIEDLTDLQKMSHVLRKNDTELLISTQSNPQVFKC